MFLQAQYAACFVCISYRDAYEFQEKFERDQQRIRQQYEEEKRRAREAEKQREEQVINEVHRRYLFLKDFAYNRSRISYLVSFLAISLLKLVGLDC